MSPPYLAKAVSHPAWRHGLDRFSSENWADRRAAQQRAEDLAREIGEKLGKFSFTGVFTSPLRRAARTCALAGFADVADSITTSWSGTTAGSKENERTRFSRNFGVGSYSATVARMENRLPTSRAEPMLCCSCPPVRRRCPRVRQWSHHWHDCRAGRVCRPRQGDFSSAARQVSTYWPLNTRIPTSRLSGSGTMSPRSTVADVNGNCRAKVDPTTRRFAGSDNRARECERHGPEPRLAKPSLKAESISASLCTATAVELLFFDHEDDAGETHALQLDPVANHTYHYWHGFVPGIRPGQIYGYRVDGPIAGAGLAVRSS